MTGDQITICFKQCYSTKQSFSLLRCGQKNTIRNHSINTNRMSNKKAIAILIDNSKTSINGDFQPTRLEAQKCACINLSDYVLSSSKESQIAIFTLGDEGGMRSSFTSSQSKVAESIHACRSGGNCKLEKNLQKAILSFEFVNPAVESKHILILLSGNHDLTKETTDYIVQQAEAKGIHILIMVMGNSVSNIQLLRDLCQRTSKRPTFNILQPMKQPTLIDAILSSEIGPGKANSRVKIEDLERYSPRLASDLRQSLNDSHHSIESIHKKVTKIRKNQK